MTLDFWHPYGNATVNFYFHMTGAHIQAVRPVAGIVLCVAVAAVLAALFGRHPASAMLPLLFIAVVFAIAMWFGTLVGITGSVLAALIFTYFLLPAGRFAVANQAARNNIAWMLLAGIVISFLLAPTHQQPHKR